MQTAEELILQYKMEEIPGEGGWFVRTYTAIPPSGLRCPATCILYLLKQNEYSAWHKLSCDEIWMYHAGSAAEQFLLFSDGRSEERIVGPDSPQSVIPAGTWQCTVLTDASMWGLFGACCVPGFEYEYYTGGNPDELKKQYPAAAALIRKSERGVK